MKNEDILNTRLGTLVLRLRMGLHPALARMVFIDTDYYGQDVKRNYQDRTFIRTLTENLEKHLPNGKVRML